MRSIFVGIEYAGKSTLIDHLDAYYQKRRRRTHLDDHFTIPDASLGPVSRAQYVHYPDDVKERMQRMQLHYHVEVIRNYPHTLIAGWHIEEKVYWRRVRQRGGQSLLSQLRPTQPAALRGAGPGSPACPTSC